MATTNRLHPSLHLACTLALLSTAACEVSALIGSNYTGSQGDTDAIAPSSSGTADTGADSTGDADTTGTPRLDVDPGLPSYGEWWCVSAEGAQTSDGQPITADDGTAPEGCQCVALNTELHAWILDHVDNDEVTIEQTSLEAELGVGAPLVGALLELRQAIYDDASSTCVELATIPDNNCVDPGLFDVDPSTPVLEPAPIHRGDRDGEIECIPEPVGLVSPCPFVSRTSDITTRNGVVQIPRQLLDGFVEQPACSMHQGWRVGIGPAGFALLGIRPNDALHRMGLRSNDHPIAISAGGDRVSLETPEGALSAYHSLSSATAFTLEVRRGATIRMFRYVTAR